MIYRTDLDFWAFLVGRPALPRPILIPAPTIWDRLDEIEGLDHRSANATVARMRGRLKELAG